MMIQKEEEIQKLTAPVIFFFPLTIKGKLFCCKETVNYFSKKTVTCKSGPGNKITTCFIVLLLSRSEYNNC